jgi:hypothetical protein
VDGGGDTGPAESLLVSGGCRKALAGGGAGAQSGLTVEPGQRRIRVPRGQRRSSHGALSERRPKPANLAIRLRLLPSHTLTAITLSAPARSVWAKSFNEDGAWLPLWQHMDDSADIAEGLFDGWLASSVVELLAAPFDGDRAAARTALAFLSGMHDLGKATPAFAVQNDLLAQRMREHGLDMPPTKAELLERHLVYHSLAGHHLLSRWLISQGWSVGWPGHGALGRASHSGVARSSSYHRSRRAVALLPPVDDTAIRWAC